MKKYLSFMTRKTKLKCIGIIVLAAISSVLASVWPLRLGELYTAISRGEIGTVESSITAVFTFGLLYLLAECITIVRRVLLDCAIASHEAEIREKSIEKLLKMPVSYFAGGLSGEKTAQLNQGVAGFSQLIKIFCNDILATVMTAICTLVQVLWHAPVELAGIMILYLVVTLLISGFQIQSQNGIREKIITQKNSLDGQVCQSFSNLELIRSMAAEEYEKIRLYPVISKVEKTEKKHHRYMGTFDCLKQACKILFQVFILLTSIVLIAKGKMAASGVIPVCMLFQQLIKPIDEAYRFMDETAASAVKAKVLMEVMDSCEDDIFSIKSEIMKSEDTGTDIVLENVEICNPEKDKVLAYYEEVKLRGNKIIALCGNSGCGKTTMIRSLTRYYPYISGKINVFGKDLKEYSQRELTDKVFYVPQKAFFFAGTIKENLIYGLHHNVTDKEIKEALKKAGLFGMLENKMNKKKNATLEAILSYEIGEGGSGLSGGECQRLAIARVFLRKARMYIFDESTANIDASTAAQILTNIEEYAKSISAGVIYISHDEAVKQRCDDVIQIENKVQIDAEKEAA